MAKYKAAKITNVGQNLLMNCLAGNAELQFTRMAFGCGSYSSTDEIVALTALKNEKKGVSISSITVKSSSSVALSGILSNETLTEGFRITEIGLFAKDKLSENSAEILYAICIAEDGYADYLPAYNGYAPTKILQDFYIDVADASSTTILVDDSVAVSKAFLEANYYNSQKIDSLLNEKMSVKTVYDMSKLTSSTGSTDIDSQTETGIVLFTFNDDYVLVNTYEFCSGSTVKGLVQSKFEFSTSFYAVRTGTKNINTGGVAWAEWKQLAWEAES